MFMDLIKRRYSVRSYTDQAVGNDTLLKILEAGNIAPTGGNRQPYHVLVVKSKDGLDKLSRAANIYKAPLALIVCSKDSEGWVRTKYDDKNLAEIDATIVTDHMMLEATELGLGSLWVCHFNPDLLRAEFSIPQELTPLHILAIGYTDETPLSPDRHAEKRKGIETTVSYDSF